MMYQPLRIQETNLASKIWVQWKILFKNTFSDAQAAGGQIAHGPTRRLARTKQMTIRARDLMSASTPSEGDGEGVQVQSKW